jgi:hypothetical protein
MKKLLALLAISLITVSLFGQCVYTHIFEDAEYLKYTTGNDWNRTIYQFVANGNQYLVSYEQCEACKDVKYGESGQRNLYLYRWDNTAWKVAVDRPLRVDTYSYDERWNLTSNCYFPQMYGGNMDGRSEEKYRNSRIFNSAFDGYIEKLANGDVVIKLTIFEYKNQQLSGCPRIYYSESITLKPNGNNYIVGNDKIVMK